MSTTDVFSAPDLADREIDYRPLSSMAVASAIFGALSALVILVGNDSLESALMFTPIPLIGLALGVRSMRQISASPDQMTGAGAAKAGAIMSLVFLVAGLGYAGYVRATEVPAGYAATSFADFKPDDIDMRGNHLVPPDVAALDGRKVFIKGYFRPDSAKYTANVKRFLLVRDNNQCCFGDLSAVNFFDQVAVTMAGARTVDYSTKVFRMGGKLHIRPENATNGAGLPVYTLEADHAE